MTEIHICLMEENDIPRAAEVLSIAMLNNPHHIGVFMGNGEKERLEIEKTFLQLFRHLPGIVFLARENPKKTIKTGQDIVGVMRMKSCSGKTSDPPGSAEDEQDLEWRKAVWLQEWSRHDPPEQHWHLGPIGVLPSHQAMGIGTLLMQRFCTEVDQCAAAAYLETDLDENVRFYEKFGFKPVAESMIFDVASRYMLREVHNLS